MNKRYSKEEKKQIIAECRKWVSEGKSVKSFAIKNNVATSTMQGWMQIRKLNTNSPKTSLVHIHKIQKETKISSFSPLLVEMRCGSLSFVFNEGYSQESIEATLVSLKKCGLL